jgi:predicted Zn finger-like uncharacterized protein
MPEARIKCPSCNTVLKVAEGIAPGRAVKCPKCGTVIRVPGNVEAQPRAGAAMAEETRQRDEVARKESGAAAAEEASAAPAQPTRASAHAAAESAAAPGRLVDTVRSTGGLFVLCGLFMAGSALVTLNSGDPDRYARGPNVIIKDDEQRRGAFYTMFATVFGAGLAVAAVGGLIQLRQRWPVYLGFPVSVAAALIWAAALFASNAHILWFLGSVGGAILLCASLVPVLVELREARIAGEFQELRGEVGEGDDEGEGIAKLVRLIRHPKSGIRLEAIRELTRLGPTAAPAVPELITLLLKAVPADASQKGVCAVCGEALSMWTRDRVKSPEHPEGFPACMGCRNRLVHGQPGEAQFVAEALGAIGAAAAAAVPALRQATGSYDPLLRPACQAAIQRIQGTDKPA